MNKRRKLAGHLPCMPPPAALPRSPFVQHQPSPGVLTRSTAVNHAIGRLPQTAENYSSSSVSSGSSQVLPGLGSQHQACPSEASTITPSTTPRSCRTEAKAATITQPFSVATRKKRNMLMMSQSEPQSHFPAQEVRQGQSPHALTAASLAAYERGSPVPVRAASSPASGSQRSEGHTLLANSPQTCGDSIDGMSVQSGAAAWEQRQG